MFADISDVSVILVELRRRRSTVREAERTMRAILSVREWWLIRGGTSFISEVEIGSGTSFFDICRTEAFFVCVLLFTQDKLKIPQSVYVP